MKQHARTFSRSHLLACILTTLASAADFQSLAPFYDEAQAVKAGEQLGIGSATLEGPKTVEVLSHQTFTVIYAAGKAGIQPGGGIRISMRHVPQWSPPQTKHPKGAGYLTLQTSNNADADILINLGKYDQDITWQHFPWQNLVQVTFPKQGLAPGDTLRVTFGDTSQGSPGIRVQPFDENPFTFKVFVDPLARNDYFPLAKNPSIEVIAAEPYRLNMVTPSGAIDSQPTWCIVRGEDRYGNPATSYRGTVQFSTDSENVTLPGDYTFTETDKGVHRFDNIIFDSQGTHRLNITDGPFQCTANPIRVEPKQPELQLLWGDIHGHTLFSDGRGTVEQFYDFAENVAGLDFCAVSDHAFEMPDDMWEHSKKVTNAVNKPGQFVTFQAFEWSGQVDVGGDHNVYFLDDNPPIYRTRSYYNYRNVQMYHGQTPQVNHVEDLFATLANNHKPGTVFCVPHWGGRNGNPNWHSPQTQRLIEIFSEHRRSEDWATTFLAKGHKVGIMASTDGHYGNPGYGYLKPTYNWNTQEIGMAAVAVYAKAHTRQAIFKALVNRQTYATSGDRIILAFNADNHPMGSEFKSNKAPTLTIKAEGTDTITKVEIKKNSQTVKTFEPNEMSFDATWQDPNFKPDEPSYYYIRVIQNNNEEAISSPIWVN